MRQIPALRLHLLLLAATLCLSGFARAQVHSTNQDAPEPRAWTGVNQNGQAMQIAAVYPDDESVDGLIAHAKFLRQASRDFSAAEAELRKLWLQVNYYAGFEQKYGEVEKSEVIYARNLDKIARARVELYEELGMLEQAFACAQTPYFSMRDASELGVGTEPLEEVFAHIVSLQSQRSLWERKQDALTRLMDQDPVQSPDGLEPQQVAYITEHFGVTSNELAARVSQAVQDGNMTVIASLGLRATPALAALVLMDLEGVRLNADLEPLYALATVDPGGACRLAVDHFDQGGQSFRLRTLSMLENYQPFNRPNVWDYPSPVAEGNRLNFQPPRCQVPYWIDLVAKLASDRRTRARVFELVDQIATRDALTPAMQTALIEAIAESDERNGVEILANLDTGVPLESVFPVLESAMQHPSVRVRRAAAEALTVYERSPALLAAYQDTDAEVRRSVAKSLTNRSVPEPTYGSPRSAPAATGRYLRPQVNEQSSRTLASLLQDDETSVQQVAAHALSSADWSFEDGAPYMAAAHSHDSRIAQYLLNAPYPSEKVRADVLAILANSPSAEVRAQLDQFLIFGADWMTNAHIWGVALLQRATDKSKPIDGEQVSRMQNGRAESTKELLRNLISRRLTDTVPGTVTGLMVATELRDPDLLRAALGSRNAHLADALATFADTTLVTMTSIALSSDDNADKMIGVLGRLVFRDATWNAKSVAPYFELARNSRYDAGARGIMLQYLAQGGAPDVASVMVDYANEVVDELDTLSVTNIFFNLQEDERLRLAKQASADESLRPIVRFAASQAALWVDHPGRLELARTLLSPALHDAYIYGNHYGKRPIETLMIESEWQDEDLNLLIGAMNASASGLYEPAIQAAQQLRHPQLLPVLSSLCRETADDEKQMLLVQAMGSYMTREAGEQLVQCLGAAVDHNVRGTIQNQLVQIRSYLEEAEYWAGEEKRQATESQAILDLVAMLDDEDADIRAAAIDGIASFGAKEYLPRIIRMMKDESNKVQRAARNAVRLLQHGVVTEDEGDSESGQ